MSEASADWRVALLGEHAGRPWLLVYHRDASQWTGIVEAFGNFTASGLKAGVSEFLEAPTEAELIMSAKRWFRAYCTRAGEP